MHPAGGSLQQRQIWIVAMRAGAEAFGVISDRYKVQGATQLHDLATGAD